MTPFWYTMPSGQSSACNNGPSRSTTSHNCATIMPGAIAIDPAFIQDTTIKRKPAARAACASSSAAVRPPHLSSLDVHEIIASQDSRQVRDRVDRLVGAHGNPAATGHELLSGVDRHGLLEQIHAHVRK